MSNNYDKLYLAILIFLKFVSAMELYSEQCKISADAFSSVLRLNKLNRYSNSVVPKSFS